jgi:hypothetical protein
LCFFADLVVLFSTFNTWRFLYVPQNEHALCGLTVLPHFPHDVEAQAFSPN